eukprot:TRINITY_DN3199_c2_g1_i2.p1 TRINITY_DN3199_c2_g1~~TRINITY_DN3199_c2_g1_i2.p1  ORF type:complete len:476 (+),score=101.59 TRINITY_DN3199_c2_g1_i2:176-1603(+)
MGFAEFRKQQKQQQKEQATKVAAKVLLVSEEGVEVEVDVSAKNDEVGEMFDLNEVWFEEEGKKGVVLTLESGKRYVVRGKDTQANVNSSKKVGFGYSKEVMKHTVGDVANHPERPERISKTIEVVTESCIHHLLTPLQAHKTANHTLAAAVHHKTLLNTVLPRHCFKPYPWSLYTVPPPSSLQCYSKEAAISFPSDTYFSEDSRHAVLASLGMTVEACDMICTGGLDSAFCLTRPPGHHCTKRQPQGFCLVNNIAIATRYVQRRYPSKRVAIIDYDVHHGDGTQEIFEADGSVVFISLHRYDKGDFYPHSGPHTDMGVGSGVGKIFNIAFDTTPGTDTVIGDAAFEAVATGFLVPFLKGLNIDLALVSSGFDAAHGDPLGRMNVKNGFARITHHIRSAVPNMLMLLEGGYNTSNVAQGTLSCLRSLLDITPPPLKSNSVQASWALSAVRTTLTHHISQASPLAPMLRDILKSLEG